MTTAPTPQHKNPQRPTPPADPPSEAKRGSPATFRIALLCAVGAAVALFLIRGNKSSAAEAQRAEQNGAEHWLKEVDDSLSRTPCRFPDSAVAKARAQELPQSLERWEELARIEPSEYLKSLIRIQEIRACFPPTAAPEPSVSPSGARLREKLSQRVRTHYALLLRAQKQGERQQALRAVNSLQVLLSAHEGPARTHLEKLARHFK